MVTPTIRTLKAVYVIFFFFCNLNAVHAVKVIENTK